MFNKPEGKGFLKDAETIIGSSVHVSGNFNGKGNMIIEGSLEGEITIEGILYVGDGARVVANIEAKEARLGGNINGNIKIKEYLEISSSAIINGNITTNMLSIAKGAAINGKIEMNTAAQS